MDCERFEANMIDELYEELDELTSAAAKRHVAGCARCASLLGGLRATRRVAVLPIVEPSLDLEDRILAAARNAQKVVPIGRRFSRAISLAGSWAMRPQTAMAAVFVLMVGSSVLFVRRGRVAASDSVTVTGHGQPAEPAPYGQQAADEPNAPVDSKAAAAAHGPQHAYAPPPATPSPLAAATSAASESPVASSSASGGYPAKSSMLPKAASDSLDDSFGGDERKREALNASTPAGAPQAPRRSQASPVAKDDGMSPSDLDKVAQNPPAPWGSLKAGSGGSGATAGGQAAQGAGPNAAAELQAANTTRDTNGCGAAVGSYDQIAAEAWGTNNGYEAMWAAGECYRALGRNDVAQQRYQRLFTVPKYAQQAQSRNNQLAASQNQTQVAARAATKKAAPTKPAAPPATSASAAPQQQAPAQSTPAAQQQQQRAF